MRKAFLKRALTIASAVVLTLGMSTVASAAEDVVLNDSGSPFIKTFDPGTKGEYKYLGYAYCFEVGPEYKYLSITYTGDPTAFDELRLEFVVNSDPSEEKKLTPCWFRENDEGTIKTIEGKEVPAPSDKEQTAIIDLEKSGIDLTTGIRAFHIHDTPGKGVFKIKDARLMTSIPGKSDSGSDNSSNTNSKSDSKTSGTDSKSDSSTNSGSGSSSSKSATATEDTSDTQTSTGASTAAPTTGSATYPIAVAIGGIVVAGAAFVVSGKLKED